MLYLTSFLTFFKIGLFTFGGGYAMISLIEREIVEKKKWITREEFLDLLAVSQSAPGVMSVNVSIFVGYKLKGNTGSIFCALGTILPSFIIILLIAMFFSYFKENEVVERIFKGIRPAIVALIAVPVINMAKAAGISYRTAIIPIAAALLIWVFDVSPVYIVLTAGIGGIVYGYFQRKNMK
ncbi:MAG: chromate transporter [Candidatus Azobacteroides sp.]|nr:chromate transporter [Candidatus Azobacteroides sp.]